MNPYIAGTMLGIVLLLAMFLSGRGLGASGGIKYCVVSIVGAVDHSHAEGSTYYSKYFEGGKKPLKNWLTIEILGVVAGGFLSGAISKRLKFKIEKSPRISDTRRLIFAFLGGVFFVFGAQLARGMHQWSCSVRYGCSVSCGICHYDCNFRLSIYFRVVFQEKLDMNRGAPAHATSCAKATEVKESFGWQSRAQGKTAYNITTFTTRQLKSIIPWAQYHH